MLLSHQAPLHIGAVTLAARDMAALALFYERIIGLERIVETHDCITLGSGGSGYLKLLATPQATPEPRHSAGLFHTAFLLPSRAELGAWFKMAQARGALFEGASDHLVSEAFYLSDPEGNGIEVYADRPRHLWQHDQYGFAMATERMDVAAVLREGERITNRNGRFPAETRIGHVHLRVGDIAKAEQFYSGVLGLDLTHKRPGGSFFSAGGYHHHIGTNTWASLNAPTRQAGCTGLQQVEIIVREAGIIAAIAARAGADTALAENVQLALKDPWGTELTLLHRGS